MLHELKEKITETFHMHKFVCIPFSDHFSFANTGVAYQEGD
jgi:hypothetical protein